jgi:NAD(P)-dependent dehydrogenase (short-subunit alcohol dehydrogenase family)
VQPPSTGNIAVVTGATGGIGKEIARGLAQAGMTVVIGARSIERGEAAVAQIASSSNGAAPAPVVMPVDMADLASIRSFASSVGARFSEVSVLVNNAGAWFTDRRVSSDGIELTFATNVLGPHVLTELLLPRLRAASRARVVNLVSSFAGSYDASDLQSSRTPYDGAKAYAQSKQALEMLTWGLAARTAGSGVTANCAEPGFVRTDLNRHAKGFRTTMINVSVRLFGVPPAKGADTPLWVATASELAGVTGKCFAKRKAKADQFREPAAIADLERACLELERDPAP